ncbi:hypothetical protein CHH28_08035 [Bacterioplanes sanyensis]|uniref:TonB-dependent receptor n=1 Tax=Bacterioplanes sanyensis TaxID=1249553 RepID=A0A222FI12_9GAMM|nr:TonB-dependent receptor [Bacterioplanes sanyensis]ASP38628.1 hypothetical protein CHH28_08035 [Bacterioplanes sanyensis]
MRTWPCMVLAALAADAVSLSLEDEFLADEMALDSPFQLESELPVVLTASRLRQARADVPASVTVIEAEQIEAWGVRTIPELMRFVPGMFLGHGDNENNASVTYHAGNPNLTRRMQVLVDGRSVIRPGIAAVVWDDLAVAMEDIQRVEVTRGPNSAIYGANAFLGVINIITRHPADSTGTRLRYRVGNQTVRDAFASTAGVSGLSSYRISANFQGDDGYDGSALRNGGDQLRDSKRHGFVNGYYHRQLAPWMQLNAQASLKRGHTDIRRNGDEEWSEPLDQDTDQQYLWGKLQLEHSMDHTSHLQAYWHRNERLVGSPVCVPTITFDPGLFGLYQTNPDWVNTILSGNEQLLGLLLGGADAEQISSLTGVTVSDAEVAEAIGVLARAVNPAEPESFANLSEVSCGDIDWNMVEQRYDLEWQDTFVWSDTVRTVGGINFRRDQADSDTYFNGYVKNDTYRAFGNLEWRFFDAWLMNLGGTYESEEANDSVFSPRAAVNWLLSPQHSVRFVASQAVRSPDLLEQEPEYALEASNLSENYLGLDKATFFMNQTPDSRDLDHEKITSWELGYYGNFASIGLELDVKLFRNFQTELISDPINLQTISVRSDTKMRVQGADLQAIWRFSPRDMLWLSAAYVDANVTPGGSAAGLSEKDLQSLQKVELRSSARDSVVASWIHKGDSWRLALSHFWHDAYGDEFKQNRRYRRMEANVNKYWQIGRYRPYVGAFYHRIIDNSPLIYIEQRYNTKHLYHLQLGLDF